MARQAVKLKTLARQMLTDDPTTTYKWSGSLLDLNCCHCCPYDNGLSKDLIAEASSDTGLHTLSPWDAPPGEIIGRSFSGTPTHEPELFTHWALGDSLSDFNSSKRQSIVRAFFTLIPRIASCESAMQCGKTPVAILGDYGDDGNLRAVLIARHLDKPPSECREVCAFCGVCCCTGTAGFEACCAISCAPGASSIVKKFKVVDTAMKRMHKTYAPQEHLYIYVMAVLPDRQGEGACSRLMRTASRYADKHGIPAYLETSGERNPKIYGRFGYAISERTTLVIPSKPEDAFNEFHAMVRQPGSLS